MLVKQFTVITGYIKTLLGKTSSLSVRTAIFTVSVLLFGVIVGPIVHSTPAINPVVTVEAGSPVPDAGVFTTSEGDTAEYITDITGLVLNKIGDIELLISVNNIEHDVTLRVVDTIAPTATVLYHLLAMGEILTVDAFVENIEDATEVTVSFKDPPDFTTVGKHDFTVVLRDEGRNVTELTTSVYIFAINDGIEVEAGTFFMEIPLRDFLVRDEGLTGMYDNIPMSLRRGISQGPANTVGRYEALILLNNIEFTSYINVIDTTAPTATPVNVNLWLGQKAEPIDFVEDAHDFSEFTARFLTEPDFSVLGTHEVTVILEDIWGNASQFTSEVTITRNTTPPEIRGASNFTVFLGARILYRNGVTAWSIVDGDIDFTVDASAVNANEVGSYPVRYTAVDSNGLRTTVSVTVNVIVYTPASVYDLADAVLARIINPGMGQAERVSAIHRWVRGNIRYGSNSEYDRLRAAFNGFQRRVGNCFTYYAVSSVLLERAGVSNRRITRTPGARPTNHSWNLVNIGGAWYHFDATPNSFGLGAFFTDDAARRISESVSPGYYTYNPASYPSIVGQLPGTIVEEEPVHVDPGDDTDDETTPGDGGGTTLPGDEDDETHPGDGGGTTLPGDDDDDDPPDDGGDDDDPPGGGGGGGTDPPDEPPDDDE